MVLGCLCHQIQGVQAPGTLGKGGNQLIHLAEHELELFAQLEFVFFQMLIRRPAPSQLSRSLQPMNSLKPQTCLDFRETRLVRQRQSINVGRHAILLLSRVDLRKLAEPVQHVLLVLLRRPPVEGRQDVDALPVPLAQRVCLACGGSLKCQFQRASVEENPPFSQEEGFLQRVRLCLKENPVENLQADGGLAKRLVMGGNGVDALQCRLLEIGFRLLAGYRFREDGRRGFKVSQQLFRLFRLSLRFQAFCFLHSELEVNPGQVAADLIQFSVFRVQPDELTIEICRQFQTPGIALPGIQVEQRPGRGHRLIRSWKIGKHAGQVERSILMQVRPHLIFPWMRFRGHRQVDLRPG